MNISSAILLFLCSVCLCQTQPTDSTQQQLSSYFSNVFNYLKRAEVLPAINLSELPKADPKPISNVVPEDQGMKELEAFLAGVFAAEIYNSLMNPMNQMADTSTQTNAPIDMGSVYGSIDNNFQATPETAPSTSWAESNQNQNNNEQKSDSSNTDQDNRSFFAKLADPHSNMEIKLIVLGFLVILGFVLYFASKVFLGQIL